MKTGKLHIEGSTVVGFYRAHKQNRIAHRQRQRIGGTSQCHVNLSFSKKTNFVAPSRRLLSMETIGIVVNGNSHLGGREFTHKNCGGK